MTGRTAVVTGASRGLGAGIARVLFAEGLNLGLCARSPLSAWEWPAPGDADAAQRVHRSSLDVRDADALESFAACVAERFGAIDLWINNAGVLDPIGPLRDQSASEVAEHLSVNVGGVVVGSQVFVRHLHRVRRDSAADHAGVLINISSGAARRPYAGWAPYCASKAAVDRLTECLQVEEAEHGLRAYAVAPGVIDTEMQAKIRACTPERFPEVERFLELRRTGAFSSAEFVARQLLELAFGARRRESEVLLRLPAESDVEAGVDPETR